MIIINTDGGARGNPGVAGAAAVVKRDGALMAEVRRYLGDQCTNNFAEYQGLLMGLEKAKELGFAAESIEVRMDSELVVKQMRGEYKVKDAGLKVEHAKACALLEDFADVSFVHVRREENSEADRLANEAMDEG